MFTSLWSPSNGDTYTTDEHGQWWRVCHYTHEWFRVDGPPKDGRPCSDVRVAQAQAAVDT